MMLVSGSSDEIARVAKDHGELHVATGLHVSTRDTKSPEEHRRSQSFPCVVTCDAIDNPGIVRAVARALRDLGLNIVSLETTTYEAPVTGSPLFRLEATCDVPRGVTLAKIRAQMHDVAERENIDIDVAAVK
jgi:glycine cleavage system transcriptional repressor